MNRVKVLLVDDEPTKLSSLVDCLTENGLTSEEIDIARSSAEARQKLSETVYDLLITDLMLPSWTGGEPARDGGLGLLKDLVGDDRLRLPTSVIGLTQYGELHEDLADEFRALHWSLDLYDPSQQGWRDRLGARTRYLLRAAEESKSKSFGIDVAVVTALPHELQAVRELPWNWQRAESIDETSFCHEGSYSEGPLSFSAVAACAPRMGMVASALLASKIITTFRPRLLVMTGICAGVKKECAIGDVLLADPCWDYQSGKIKRTSVLISPDQIDVSLEVQQPMLQLSEDMSALKTIYDAYRGTKKPDKPPRILIGPVACGSAVLADRDTIKEIKDTQHRALIGVEMEQYGVYSAAKDAGLPRPRVMGIKAVVDYATGAKNSDFQPYGSYVSAQVLHLFLRRYGKDLFAMG